MKASNDNYFVELSKINVTEHVERKGQFSYLSWPFAVSQLRQFDPVATWQVLRFDGLPYLNTEAGCFVEVSVCVKGISLSQIHPVLDSKNRPILAPTSFDINTSIQRCLVKAIALHGLGLNLYAGEDLPLIEADDDKGTTATTSPPAAPPAPAPVTSLPTPRGDTITPAQVNYINRLIKETSTELQRVLDYFGIARIEDIAKTEASRVIRSLEQARNRKEAA
jgi:hypothetical protein